MEDVTEQEDVVVTTPFTTPDVKTTSAEPLMEDDLVVSPDTPAVADRVPV